ncbi:MAG: ATP-binding protein [Dehalococcoidia bacterium]
MDRAISVTRAVLSDVLDAAPDAFIGVDGRGRIVLVNTQAVALFGYAADELLGQPLEVLVPLAARGGHEALRERYQAAPTTRAMGVTADLAARRKDGTEFPTDISLSAIETEHGPLFMAAIRDSSERIEAQRERARLSAEAQHSRTLAQVSQSRRLESLGELAGGVAHDFNNLLGVILNYSAFVSETLAAVAPQLPDPHALDGARDDLKEVYTAAERAARLTRQLLAFARRQATQPETIDLNAVVREIEELLRRTISEHVRLHTQLATEPTVLSADRGQLEQILVNLAVNARDAMPGGGILTIDTDPFEVDEEYVERHPELSPGLHVRLRVSDTGIGMTPEVMARAFQPFFTTKPVGEGSGLGLATVYGIVTQAGGSIRLYSEPGVGTTVTILLPASDATPDAATGGDAAHPRGGGRILLVEDEAALREVTRRLLVRNGYEVLVAEDGAHAVQLAAEHPAAIDLLLTDVVMPRMGGKEVAERVAALRPGIGVLYMSGYAEPIITANGTLPPDVHLVPKPFSEPVLAQAVAGAMRGAPPPSLRPS